MNKRKLYWICQISGWSILILVNIVVLVIKHKLTPMLLCIFAIVFSFGILISHQYRNYIKSREWHKLSFRALLPRVLAATTVLALMILCIQIIIELYLNKYHNTKLDLSPVIIVLDIVNFIFVFLIWSLFYFLFKYVDNYKKEEIKNLKWEASINEIELNKLKSQLNPHFVFNALNSIRALVEEDPNRAKESITQLSNILRNSLALGKSKLTPFDDELKIVRDYLALEKTRFEERLKVDFNISPDAGKQMVPPMMIQTLVENSIKHGISTLKEGGKVEVHAQFSDSQFIVTIINSGQLKKTNQETNMGYGIANTLERLKLLYGNKATFDLSNSNQETVITTLTLPTGISIN